MNQKRMEPQFTKICDIAQKATSVGVAHFVGRAKRIMVEKLLFMVKNILLFPLVVIKRNFKGMDYNLNAVKL